MTCTYAMMSDCGTRGTTTRHVPGYRKESKQSVFRKEKRKKKWTGWKPKTDEQTNEFGKKVMEGGENKIEEDSAVVKKKLLRLPLVKWRITQKLKEKNFQSPPENVRFVRKLLQDARKR